MPPCLMVKIKVCVNRRYSRLGEPEPEFVFVRRRYRTHTHSRQRGEVQRTNRGPGKVLSQWGRQKQAFGCHTGNPPCTLWSGKTDARDGNASHHVALVFLSLRGFFFIKKNNKMRTMTSK